MIRQREPLALLDRILLAMDSRQRPTDFAVLLSLPGEWSFERLAEGARAAVARFPKAGSTLRGHFWKSSQKRLLSNAGSTDLASWFGQPIDLTRYPPVQQILVPSQGDADRLLATRFHHAAADGVSAVLFLNQQLSGSSCSVAGAISPESEIELLSGQAGYPPRPTSTSVPLACSGSEPSGERHWRTVRLRGDEIRRYARASGASYTCLLASVLLRSIRAWNRSWEEPADPVSLWFPVNLRRRPRAGFGNGAGRIRLLAARQPLSAQLEAAWLARQLRLSRRSPECWVPRCDWLSRLPRRFSETVLRRFLSRSSVDMGTVVFSHLDRLCLPTAVSRIEIVGMMHSRHPLAVNGATVGEHTWITFTHDPSLLTDRECQQLLDRFVDELVTVLKEMGCEHGSTILSAA